MFENQYEEHMASHTEFWNNDMSFFEVAVDNRRVHSTEDRANAIIVARWWMAGCPV